MFGLKRRFEKKIARQRIDKLLGEMAKRQTEEDCKIIQIEIVKVAQLASLITKITNCETDGYDFIIGRKRICGYVRLENKEYEFDTDKK